MRRRELIAGLALFGPCSFVLAQAPVRVYRVAIATTASRPSSEEAARRPFFGAFLRELGRRGFTEGKNLALEWWPTEGRFERFKDIAAAAAGSKPDVVLVVSPDFALHLKRATSTVPIVAVVNDAVADGFAASLSRPGGNVTGISSTVGFELIGKRFDLLKEVLPSASRLAYLGPKYVAGTAVERATKQAARQAGVTLVEAYVDSPVDEASYRRAFDALRGANVDAILTSGATENFTNMGIIVQLAKESRIPTIYTFTGPTRLGGLVASYPSTPDELGRLCAHYVDSILRGAKPGDLPFSQPTNFSISINLQTAKELGLTIPPSLLIQADEVIE